MKVPVTVSGEKSDRMSTRIIAPWTTTLSVRVIRLRAWRDPGELKKQVARKKPIRALEKALT